MTCRPPPYTPWATALQANGYNTGLVGKWHIQSQPQGFDYYSIFFDQGEYRDPTFIESTDPWPGNRRFGERVPGFSTDLVTEKAIKWIKQQDGKQPFMMCCHFKATHEPYDYPIRMEHLYDGVTFPEPENLLDWGPETNGRSFVGQTLEELERRRGIPVGTVKISMLLETAKGIMNAYECCMASSRNVNAIFGAVDYCRDMRVKLTSEAVEQMWGRAKMAIAARAAGIVAIDAPFVAYQDIPAFERNVMEGKQMGYEGRMIIHPSQVEPSNRLYAPDPADVEWANGVVKVFEEEGLAKGKAAVSYLGKMVDTPVYLNAKDILAAQAEIDAKVKK